MSIQTVGMWSGCNVPFQLYELLNILSWNIEGFHCVDVYRWQSYYHGPLTRYVHLWVAHASGMPGTFSPPPISKIIASQRSRHASRHVRHACAVMHVGIANPRWRGKRSRHSRRMRNPQFYVSGKRPMYLWVKRQPKQFILFNLDSVLEVLYLRRWPGHFFPLWSELVMLQVMLLHPITPLQTSLMLAQPSSRPTYQMICSYHG